MLRGTSAVAALAAVALALATGLLGSAAAQEGTGALAVDCEGNTTAIDAACEFGDGQSFSISVHVTETPGGEYGGFQIRMQWDPAIVEYVPAASPAEEAVWADCTLPVRDETRTLGEPPLSFGCLNFSAQSGAPELTTFTGVGAIFGFQCVGPGTSEVALVPIAEESILGTTLLSEIGINLASEVTNASVTCGGEEVSRPTSQVNAGVTAVSQDEVTPAPTTTPVDGEGDGNGQPTNGDSSGASNGDDDGGGIEPWVWVVIVFGVILVAAVGVGWARVRGS